MGKYRGWEGHQAKNSYLKFHEFQVEGALLYLLIGSGGSYKA